MRGLGWVLIFLTSVAFGQTPHFVHSSIGEEYGTVRYQAMYLDQQSLVWVAANKGLFTFDGQEFRQIGPPGDSILVTCIYQDPGGRHWTGTSSGNLYNIVRDRFVPVAHTRDTIGARITGITAISQNVLLVSTYGEGLWEISDSTVRKLKMPANPAVEDIYTMRMTSDSSVWLGTDFGIVICSPDADSMVMRVLGKEEGIPDEIVIALSRPQHGRIWAGTFDRGIAGVHATDYTIEVPVIPWQYGSIVSLVPVDSLEIWVGTSDRGLFRYNHADKRIQQIDLPSVNMPQIIDGTVDAEGNLWFLDEYSGLFRANRHLQSYPTAIENIQALYFDHGGSLFAGSQEGLYRLHDSTNYRTGTQILPDDVNVLSLFEDDNHYLWVGTFGQGLYRLDPMRTDITLFTKVDGLTDESILSITGYGGKLWLATLGGVTEIDLAPDTPTLNTRNYNLADGLGTNFIFAAVADSQGRIWFGTDGNGLSVLDHDKLRNYQYIDSIALHSVLSISEDPAGNIWCSTDRTGIVVFDGTELRLVRELRHLPEEEISSIAADAFGRILLAHERGMDLYFPTTRRVISFGAEAGLLDFVPNLNALFTDRKGHIWVGGRSRIVEYTPLNQATRFAPDIALTDVRVFLDPVDFRDKQVFGAAENYLTFAYRGIWHTSSQDVHYRYKLEGLDPDWKYTRENTAAYPHIPPGEYRFVIQATNSDHFNNESSVSYAFTIQPPLYERVWFIALICIILVLALWLFVRQRERRMARAAEIRRQQVESQLQTLKAQINPHFLFNSFNTLVSAIEEDPERAVVYLERLSDFYRNILRYREENLIPLREELEVVGNYIYLLRTRFGRNLKLEVDVPDPRAKIVPLTLQMLLENAIKHNIISKSRPLTINIHADNDYIEVYNQIQRKQTSETSTHYGLQNIVKRYELITQRPVIIEEGRSVFRVKIPIITDHEVSDH